MPFYDNLTEDQKRSDTFRPVWPMSGLPSEPARQMGDSCTPRMPVEFERPIRDFNHGRRRSGDFQGNRRTAYVSQLLRRVASVGKPLWEPEYDPLFWCLRMGRDYRSTAFSLGNLESYQELPTNDPRKLQLVGSLPTTLSYRSMAAWACSRLRPQPSLREILVQIYNEIQHGRGSSGAYPLLRTESVTWLKWIGIAHKGIFPLPLAESTFRGSDHLGWKEMGLGPMDAATLLGFMQIYGNTDDARTRSNESQANITKHAARIGFQLAEDGL